MAGVVPSLALPQHKLDKLADELARLEVNQVIVAPGAGAVPTFQRQGYLEKLGHQREKWFKRFFVLRDSFLLGYNLQKSDYTVEPRAAIHMGNSQIQLMDHDGRQFCFMITTMQQDKFIFAAESEADRNSWVQDLEVARKITHANMVKLSVENRCLAETKGAVGVALEHTTSALALFSNPEYIQNTPITGGAEGWLRTRGFNPEDQVSKGVLGLNKQPSIQKLYFILRDSHLLMFQGGDMLTKPRGVMFLLGTKVEALTASDADSEFHFRVKSYQCGDEIELITSSNRIRQRWMDALRVGGRVTYPDFKLLLKEHEILASVSMTPRAAPPSKPNAPSTEQLPPVPMLHEDFDIQGQQLDPGTEQAYDEKGNPILRNPEGKLTSVEGEVLVPSTPRFNAAGQQLDPFNRPLPPGAVPMFTKEGTPIGVGPDGNHYLPDGTEIPRDAPHFDANGAPLDQNTVTAADAVATNVAVALKVRQVLKGEAGREEPVDVLGRTFRGADAEKSIQDGVFVNADGDAVPLKSARKIQNESGQLVQYDAAQKEKKAASQNSLRVMTTDDNGSEQLLGTIEINELTTLKKVRQTIESDLNPHFSDFIFLFNGVPLLKYEEGDKFASSCGEEVYVRGHELKTVKPVQFTKKIAEIKHYEDQKKKEQNEFEDVLARVRQGKFLRSTKAQFLEE